MESKNHCVATRFAENLVGAMLQRSGVEFFHAQSGRGSTADFLVQNGDRFVAIEVKYAADPNNADAIWKAWLTSIDDGALAGSSSQEPGKAQDDPPHLVIVTGAGEHVFTDAATAPLLEPDRRTSLAILGAVASRQKRATSGAMK